MDEIEMLLKKIKNDREIKNTRYFSSNFLANVGEVFERYGFEETRLFLLDRKKSQLKDQATALLKVLEMMKDIEKIKRNRSIGRYVFKNMIAIKSLKEV